MLPVQDPNECFSTHKEHLCRPLGELQNVDEDVTKYSPPKNSIQSWESGFIAAVLNYGAFWSVRVQDKPFNSLSSSLCVAEPVQNKTEDLLQKQK